MEAIPRLARRDRTSERVDFDEYTSLLAEVAEEIMAKDAARAEANLVRLAAVRGAR